MRAIVAAFLAPFLIALPVTQVLAQATQQEPYVTQTSEPGVLLSGPVVDSNNVLLLAPASVEFLPATDSLPGLRSAPMSTAAEVGIVVAVVLVGIALVALVIHFGLYPCARGSCSG
jgi:hypothetical protein